MSSFAKHLLTTTNRDVRSEGTRFCLHFKAYLTRFLLFYAIGLLFSTHSFGQQHSIKNYTSKDGLADQIVNAAFQDSDGYIWFATQAGISIYDGNSFQDFIPSDELKGIDAVTITETSDGAIWIGSNSDGVFRYDYSNLEHYSSNNGLPNEVVRSFYVDEKNKLWVATSGGVAFFSESKWHHFEDPEKKLNNGVLSIAQTNDGLFWFGTQGNGLISFDGTDFHYHEDAVADKYIFSLQTIRNKLYVGTTSAGVFQLSNGKFSKIIQPQLDNAWISNIVQLDDGVGFISSNGFVKLTNDGTFELISEENGLISNDLYNGLYDRENNIWLTSGNGVSCLRSEQILFYDKSSGLSSDKVTAIHKLSNGTIALACNDQGINILSSNGKMIKSILPLELENQMITSLLEVPSRNELWVGLNLAEFGILVLDMNSNSFAVKRTIDQLNDVPIKSVTKLELGKNNSIWVGSYTNGLFKVSDKKAYNYSEEDGLPSNAVYTFTLDNSGSPIVSLYQEGVYRLKNNRFTSLSDAYGLKEKFVQSIECSNDGTIYLGNKTEGLTIISTSGKVLTFGTEEGLLSNLVQAICIDNNEVWCGSDRGLNKLIFHEGRLSKLETLNEKGGLINSEVQQNALQLHKRHLWVGSSTGLSKINLDQNHANKADIQIELQGIKLYYEDVDWTKKNVLAYSKRGIPTELQLSHKDNHLTFVFNAVTSNPVKYSYFLKGSDNAWSPFIDSREATFSNLAPGSYTFMVKSLDYHGNESLTLKIPIIITPPFFLSFWFRIAIIGFLLIVIYWIIKRRERNYRNQQEKLELIVESRTKEAFEATELAKEQRQIAESKNKEIMDSIEYAKRIQSAMLPTLEDIRTGFPNSELFYQPKDIVAGDFFWYQEINNLKLIAVADCTGHGVPGALMSVVCYNALNKSIQEYSNSTTGEILDQAREIIIHELSKSDSEMQDGMDISLLLVDDESKKVEWSGANTPLWIISNESGDLVEIKGNKQPIGVHINNQQYTTHQLPYEEGTMYVLFSDGYADQFGGQKGKKFKSPNFKKLLHENKDQSMNAIGEIVKRNFFTWKGELEQVDDVCVLLIKL
ncbi:MAG: two-component regulator propeller domain-containing protein [Crocinitomicaceae bacterium]